LFAHAQQDNYSVRGALTYQDRGREVHVPDVKVSVRGNSSRNESECTFPKLKLEWPSASLKIGTHCGESTDGSVTAKFGRLPNEHSPRREAFVYQLLDVLQVLSLKARPARITYVSSGREPLVRNAATSTGACVSFGETPTGATRGGRSGTCWRSRGRTDACGR
ncbi:MAG: hypothetical protein DMF93_19845, partial [Acidobacteria bacterium]